MKNISQYVTFQGSFIKWSKNDHVFLHWHHVSTWIHDDWWVKDDILVNIIFLRLSVKVWIKCMKQHGFLYLCMCLSARQDIRQRAIFESVPPGWKRASDTWDKSLQWDSVPLQQCLFAPCHWQEMTLRLYHRTRNCERFYNGHFEPSSPAHQGTWPGHDCGPWRFLGGWRHGSFSLTVIRVSSFSSREVCIPKCHFQSRLSVTFEGNKGKKGAQRRWRYQTLRCTRIGVC